MNYRFLAAGVVANG